MHRWIQNFLCLFKGKYVFKKFCPYQVLFVKKINCLKIFYQPRKHDSCELKDQINLESNGMRCCCPLQSLPRTLDFCEVIKRWEIGSNLGLRAEWSIMESSRQQHSWISRERSLVDVLRLWLPVWDASCLLNGSSFVSTLATLQFSLAHFSLSQLKQ